MVDELMITCRPEIKRYPKYLGADIHQNMVRVARTSPEGWMLQIRGKTQMATADYLTPAAARALISKLLEIVMEIDDPPTKPRFNMYAKVTEHGPPLNEDEADERGSEG